MFAYQPSLEVAWEASVDAISCASIGLQTNSDECEIAGTTMSEEDIAKNWQDFGCEEVVVKVGEGGCLLARPDGNQVIPVKRLIMVDASGAGDAFNAGYLSARIEGRDPEEAAARGQRIAGWVIRRHGAVAPVDDDLRQLLADFRN